MDEKKKGAHIWIIRLGIPLLILQFIYLIALNRPQLLHKEHEYLGYTYYSSILNFDFAESDAESAFDSIMRNEPSYIWLLDSFYKDGYHIFFDDKLTYALCSADLFHSGDFAACVAFDNHTGEVRSGMFVNYENDYFSETNFFHELSHYADHKMGDISKSDEFKEIYSKEYKDSILGDKKYYTNISEYFAQESAYYILYDSKSTTLATNITPEDAPETFTFIGENLEKLRIAN